MSLLLIIVKPQLPWQVGAYPQPKMDLMHILRQK